MDGSSSLQGPPAGGYTGLRSDSDSDPVLPPHEGLVATGTLLAICDHGAKKCRHGKNCHDINCKYTHNPCCRWGIDCNNKKTCRFRHGIDCRYGINCERYFTCRYNHPIRIASKTRCKFGINCNRPNCTFFHSHQKGSQAPLPPSMSYTPPQCPNALIYIPSGSDSDSDDR